MLQNLLSLTWIHFWCRVSEESWPGLGRSQESRSGWTASRRSWCTRPRSRTAQKPSHGLGAERSNKIPFCSEIWAGLVNFLSILYCWAFSALSNKFRFKEHIYIRHLGTLIVREESQHPAASNQGLQPERYYYNPLTIVITDIVGISNHHRQIRQVLWIFCASYL